MIMINHKWEILLICVIAVFFCIAFYYPTTNANSLNGNQLDTYSSFSDLNNTRQSNNILPPESLATSMAFNGSKGNLQKETSSNSSMDHVISLFDAYVNSTFPKTGIPGAAVVIVQNDKIVYMNCLGVRHVASGEPVTPNTLFQLASCTKAFTSTNVAQLVDQGLLSWDDKITKYYPDPTKFKLYDDEVTREVTIRDVLIQRVGLPPNSGDEFGLFNYSSYDDGLYKIRYFKNASEFRTTFSYNNILYSLAGECAARANKTTWSELIKKDLLEPLNMTNAATTYNDFINSPDRIHTYIHIDGVLQERVPLNPVNRPAGVLASSIKDIANWLAFQIRDDGTFQGKRIVSKTNLDLTRTGQINMTNGQYGFGWNIGQDMISHSGSEYYSNSIVTILPSQKIGIAVVTNEGTYGTAFNTALTFKLIDLLKGNISTDPWPDWKKQLMPQPALPEPNGTIISPKILSTYTGVYSNELFGNITITTNNNALICYYGNDTQPFNLIHWNGDVFEEKNYNQAFNFTDIYNDSAHYLTTNIKDYTDVSFPPAVFNRTNST